MELAQFHALLCISVGFNSCLGFLICEVGLRPAPSSGDTHLLLTEQQAAITLSRELGQIICILRVKVYYVPESCLRRDPVCKRLQKILNRLTVKKVGEVENLHHPAA